MQADTSPIIEFSVVKTFNNAHSERVTSISIGTDGSLFATASHDKSIKIWDLHKRTLLFSFQGAHDDKITAVAFVPNSSHLLSVSRDKSIRAWDVSEKLLIDRVNSAHSNWIEALVVDPKGETFYTGSIDHSIKIWNVKDLSIIYTIAEAHQDYVYSLAISRDGSLLASGSRDKSVKLWNLRKLSQEHMFANAHKDEIQSLAFTNDMKFLVTSSIDKSIKIWNLEQRTLVHAFKDAHSYSIYSITTTPDSKFVISGSLDNSIKLWDLTNYCEVYSMPNAHQYCIYCVALSKNGRYLISGSNDNAIKIWNVRTRSSLLNSCLEDLLNDGLRLSELVQKQVNLNALIEEHEKFELEAAAVKKAYRNESLEALIKIESLISENTKQMQKCEGELISSLTKLIDIETQDNDHTVHLEEVEKIILEDCNNTDKLSQIEQKSSNRNIREQFTKLEKFIADHANRMLDLVRKSSSQPETERRRTLNEINSQMRSDFSEFETQWKEVQNGFSSYNVLQGIEGIKKKLSEYSQIRNMLVQKLPNEMSQYVSISSLFDRKARLTEELQVLDEKLEEIKLQNHKTELELQTKYEMKNKYLQTSNMKALQQIKDLENVLKSLSGEINSIEDQDKLKTEELNSVLKDLNVKAMTKKIAFWRGCIAQVLNAKEIHRAILADYLLGLQSYNQDTRNGDNYQTEIEKIEKLIKETQSYLQKL